VPVLFGPRFRASRDAELLLECGGGFSAASAAELSSRLTTLFADAAARSAAGTRARDLVEAGLGAADRSAALVESLIAGRR
jgi:3-deoxy-D-manno-octulosonic-acid transferase